MGGHPSAEQFYALAKVGKRYRDFFFNSWRDACGDEGPIPADALAVAGLVKRAMAISESAFEASFDEQSWGAFEWLSERPEFAIAKQAVGFRPLGNEGHSSRFERIIWSETKFCSPRDSWWAASRLSDASARYLDYVAGVSRAAADFISGNAAKAAIESRPTFDRMRELVKEFRQLLDAEWLEEDVKRICSYQLCRLDWSIERRRPIDPVSKRNDADLPARLMASELIRLHHALFSATHKRAIYHLMGLPFIERPLEIRTIERLAKAEKERWSK